ncbi:unnamed protein product [Absidia cylindrospora]
MATSNNENDIEGYSGIRLRKRYMKLAELEKKMDSLDYIPCHNLSSRVQRSIYVTVKKANNWATIGIVERSIKTDDDMLVLRMTNLRNSYFNLFLLDKSFDRYKDMVKVGTVLGITKPTVLSAEGGIGFQVSHLNQVWHIGESLDMGRCEAYIQEKKRCPATAIGEFCDAHIASVCNVSKNGRMELASGDSGIDIRWSSTSKSRQGKMQFSGVSGGTYSQMKKKEHIYSTKGKRMTSDGKELNKKPVANPQKAAQDKEAWSNFLRGQQNPGAMNIRKIIGISDNQPQTALSKDAFMKVYNKKVPENDEVASKKRTIDQILEMEQRKKNKNKKADDKPKYIYL